MTIAHPMSSPFGSMLKTARAAFSRNRVALLTIGGFFAFFLFGYGAYFHSIGYISDDIYGFVQVKTHPAVDYTLDALLNWPMSRPVSFFLYRLTFLTFSELDPAWLQLYCGLLVAIEAYLVFLLLTWIGIDRFASFVGALLMVLAPFYQSVYLPIHANFSEFATITFLVGCLLATRRRWVAAGLVAPASLLMFEHTLPLMFLPAFFLLCRSGALNQGPLRFLDLSPRSLARAAASVALAVFVVALIFWVRSKFGNGREMEVAGADLGAKARMMVDAGWAGFWSIFEAFKPGFVKTLLDLSPGFGAAAFGGAILTAFAFRAYGRAAAPGLPQHLTPTLIFTILALALIWISHIVYITPERFPPEYLLGRLSNTHNGARIGACAIAAGIIGLFTSRQAVALRYAGAATGLLFAAYVTSFSFAYGAQTARVWEKTTTMADGVLAACAAGGNEGQFILWLDDDYGRWHTDPLVDWSTYLMPQMFFKRAEGIVLLTVASWKGREFLDALKSAGPEMDFTPYSDPAGAYFVSSIYPNYLTLNVGQTHVVRLVDGRWRYVFGPGEEGRNVCRLKARPAFKPLFRH